MDKPLKSKRSFFSEWLEKLQQESWQLELLISGLALFGIWESGDVIERLKYYLDVNSISAFRIYGSAIIGILNAGRAIFLVNLLIHIIVRGLWIGAIGLRYVSGDIDFTELNYSPVFREYYEKRIGSFDDYIERLEKLSSVLFSFTFLLFFMFISFMAINLWFSIFAHVFVTFSDDQFQGQALIGIIGMFYYGLAFIVLIDFLTLGALKKVKDRTFARSYLFLYRLFSTLSLSFIYRPLLLNFIDNKYTRRLFFLAIPYAIIILLGFGGIYLERNTYIPSFSPSETYASYISEESINWHYYDDLRREHSLSFATANNLPDKTKIFYASLDQYEQSGESMKLFLEFRPDDEKLMEERYPDEEAFKKKGV